MMKWVVVFGFGVFVMALNSLRADVQLSPASDGNDTAQIETAIAAGGVIRFGSGTYRVSKTLLVDLAKTGPVSFVGEGTAKLIMEGEGPLLHFVGTHTGTADPQTVGVGVWEKERMPAVEGLEITATNPLGDAIVAEGTMQLNVSRTLIREVRHGIHLKKRNRNVNIVNCNIYNNRGIGIFYDAVNLHQSNISASHISYCKLGGVVIRGGDVRNVHITGCDIEANMSDSEGYRANVLVECVAGSGAEIVISGCTIQHTAEVANSANIVFVGGEPKNDDSEQVRWGHLTIADNILTDAHKNVWLTNTRGATITGNSFGEGHQQHLLIEGSRSVVVGANVIDRNPPYYTSQAKNSSDAIVFRDSAECVIQGLLINGVMAPDGAIQMERCRDINLNGCSILNHGATGIVLRDCRSCFISGCVVRQRSDASSKSPSLQIVGGAENEYTGNKWQVVEVARLPLRK
jgi:hypothetical protein